MYNRRFNNPEKEFNKDIYEFERKKQIIQGIDYTANELGNTRKVCKDSYLSPHNINKFT